MFMTKISSVDRSIRLILSLIGLPMLLMQYLVTIYEKTKYKPTGWHADIGKRKLHVTATGHGSPTIILEAGMGGCSLDWALVAPALSKNANVITYDRAGLGFSEDILEWPTCSAYVDDLRALLKTLGAAPPYLLVGHSYGGMIMRLFASRFPDEVCGLVLVDATHESRYLPDETTQGRKKQLISSLTRYKLGYMLGPLGIPRIMKQHIGSKRLPEQWLAPVRALGYQASAYRAVYAEQLCTIESSLQLMMAEPLKEDLPVVVLSAGLQNEEWQQGQQKLVHLTNRTIQIIVEDSWHSIHIHKPEAVINAITSLLQEIHSNMKR